MEARTNAGMGTRSTPIETIFTSLTGAQRAAVEHVEGPLLILAGPGSGKTRVITHRVANLLHQGIPARNIVALAFTNKAADEMRRRLADLAPGQSVWMGTFHGFCARLLRQYAPLVGLRENFSIYDAVEARDTLRSAIHQHGLVLARTGPDEIAGAISWAKTELITAERYEPRSSSPLGHLVAQIYPLYQEQLRRENAADFDDLLLHVATLLRENPELRRSLDERFRYVLVDEYQDTNPAQYAIVRALSGDQPNLAVTGDPDQSIYGWRGASLNNILEFERDFPGLQIIRLEQNYRSTPNILRVADTLIEHNQRRKPKALYTENPEGAPVRLTLYRTGHEEAEGIAARIAAEVGSGRRRLSDFAIFYRTNALSRLCEHALRSYRIPYQIVKGLEFYQRKEIKDILAYLHLLNNPDHNPAFLRIVNMPPRGIGKTSLNRLEAHARNQRLSLMSAARQCEDAPGLGRRAIAACQQFVRLMDRLQPLAICSLEEIICQVLDESGYRDFLACAEDEESQERLANVEELVSAAREFDEQHPEEGSLELFLEQTSLVADTDLWDEQSERVTLMTLHAAKGLEFPVVFIIAIEEGLIPHSRAGSDPDSVEEERRLLFVGITRAKEQLLLSLVERRAFRGIQGPAIPSSFLMELPRGEMELVRTSRIWSPEEGPRLESDEQSHKQDEYDTSEPLVEESPAAGPRAVKAETSFAVTTAAAMVARGEKPAAPVAPAAFGQGMQVFHPEYGVGRIARITGSGSKSTATVEFSHEVGKKSFRLAHSQLVPLGSPPE